MLRQNAIGFVDVALELLAQLSVRELIGILDEAAVLPHEMPDAFDG